MPTPYQRNVAAQQADQFYHAHLGDAKVDMMPYIKAECHHRQSRPTALSTSARWPGSPWHEPIYLCPLGMKHPGWVLNGLKLPARTLKPRSTGLTAITDVGLPVPHVEAMLGDYADFVDIAKLGVGSAYLTPRLADKITTYRKFGVNVYFGGTLFEKFVHQKKLPEYVNNLKQLGIDWIEVSNGTIDLPLQERLAMIEHLRGDFTVLAEVGYKDNAKLKADPSLPAAAC